MKERKIGRGNAAFTEAEVKGILAQKGNLPLERLRKRIGWESRRLRGYGEGILGRIFRYRRR